MTFHSMYYRSTGLTSYLPSLYRLDTWTRSYFYEQKKVYPDKMYVTDLFE